MTLYLIRQSGFEPIWAKGSVEAVRVLCDLFGLNFAENAEKLMAQVESVQRGCAIKHPDLSLSVENIG